MYLEHTNLGNSDYKKSKHFLLVLLATSLVFVRKIYELVFIQFKSDDLRESLLVLLIVAFYIHTSVSNVLIVLSVPEDDN